VVQPVAGAQLAEGQTVVVGVAPHPGDQVAPFVGDPEAEDIENEMLQFVLIL